MTNILGVGRTDQVIAMMDICKSNAYEYDRTAQLLLSTKSGFKGSLLLDVVTKPYQKTMRLQCKQGFLEWHTNFDDQNDAIKVGHENAPVAITLVPKTRVNDFSPQIQYIDDILSSRRSLTINSVIDGLDTMEIIYAAQLSHKKQETVTI
jgi:predicted dehydrogenase